MFLGQEACLTLFTVVQGLRNFVWVSVMATLSASWAWGLSDLAGADATEAPTAAMTSAEAEISLHTLPCFILDLRWVGCRGAPQCGAENTANILK